MSTPSEHVAIDGLLVGIDRSNWSVAMVRSLYGRGFETAERRACAALLRPGERVLEAGTAVGLVAMTAARIVGTGNVVSYEADPAMVRLARSNAARNGLAIDIRHGAIVSDRRAASATIPFFRAADFAASSTVPSDTATSEVATPAVSVAAALAEVRPHAVIVDIEGGEAEIGEELAAGAAEKIILEFHPAAIGAEACRAIGDRFTDAGYRVVEPICHGQVVCFARNGMHADAAQGRFSDSAAWWALRSLDLRSDEAEAALLRAAALCPANAFIHAALSRHLLERDACDLAASHAREAVAAAPDWHAGHVSLSHAQRRQGVPNEALETVRTVLAFAGDMAAVQWEAAAVHSALGDERSAFKAISEVVRLDPLHGPAWLRRARLALALDRPAHARRSIALAARLLPGSGEADHLRTAIERRFGMADA